MLGRNTDRAWEKFGVRDPYYGVTAQAAFHRESLDEAARADFFERGEAHVERVLAAIREDLDVDYVPRRVLDFGCGVGRLVIPFARRAEHVLGADVSPSMLAEARKNCTERGVQNVRFVRSDDALSQVEGTYDLVHSYIVFQHIPVRRGLRLFERLLDHLAPGGVGALHFTFARSRKRRVIALSKAIPLVTSLSNVVRGRPLSTPQMQMNAYDLNALFMRLHRRGIRRIHARLTNHGGELGALLFFQAPPAAGDGA